MDKELLEELIRKVIKEELGKNSEEEYKQMDKSGVGVVKLNKMTKRVKMDTGNPNDQVTTTDLFTLEESPRLGAGLMEMTESTFPWTLTYDEVDYIIEGRLEILIDGRYQKVLKFNLVLQNMQNSCILYIQQTGLNYNLK